MIFLLLRIGGVVAPVPIAGAAGEVLDAAPRRRHLLAAARARTLTAARRRRILLTRRPS